ncbi:MAG: CHAD domain-containing protein [Phycisphaerales bacterium]|nr:CHAD domain-containing protein [Phycisphaerales bacterium]MCB9856613.1 CHAD domain-containing protein [Phycisphaerales bacterium]
MAANGLVKFVERHLERLEAGVDEILANGSERAVHRFRVSTRRLNEPLLLIGTVDPSAAKQVKRARKALKRLRNLFGEVRDLDVLRDGLTDERHSNGLPAEGKAKLIDMLTSQRRAGFVAALEGLSGTSPVQTASRIRNLTEDVCTKGGDKRQSALLSVAREMWRKRADAALRFDSFDDDCAGFHALRIHLKGLRYCTELLYRMENKDDDAVLTAFVGMQNALGAWNDHLFAARHLARVATNDASFANDPDWSAAILECAAWRVRHSVEQRSLARDKWPALREMIHAARDGKTTTCSKSVDAAALAAALRSVVGPTAKSP